MYLRGAGLVLLGVLGVAVVRALLPGRTAFEATPALTSAADSLAVTDPKAFRSLRPRVGDKMTPPRIGFRWTWVPDSARATVPANQVKFRVHLVSSDGTHEITRQVGDSRVHVNLRDDFPTGDCQWWVEALVPGWPSVCSARETFLLEP
jgi:hypothetical protein